MDDEPGRQEDVKQTNHTSLRTGNSNDPKYSTRGRGPRSGARRLGPPTAEVSALRVEALASGMTNTEMWLVTPMNCTTSK